MVHGGLSNTGDEPTCREKYNLHSVLEEVVGIYDAVYGSISNKAGDSI